MAPALTTEMILVMSIIGLAVVLFIMEWVRVDVVGIIMMKRTTIVGEFFDIDHRPQFRHVQTFTIQKDQGISFSRSVYDPL